MCSSSNYVSIAQNQHTSNKCKCRACSVPIVADDTTDSELSKKEATTNVSDANNAVAAKTTQKRPQEVQFWLMNGD